MFWKRQADVLVVGAGPIGLVAALMLGERDVPVEVIDEDDHTGRPDYLLTLHPSSLELLDELGIGREIVEAGASVRRVSYYCGNEPRCVLRIDALASRFPHLTVIPYDKLVGIIERRLIARKYPVRFNHRLAQLELAGDHAKATVERLGVDSGGYAIADTLHVVEKVLERVPRFVVGTDGFHSVVRRRIDIDIDEVGSRSSFAEVEFETDLDIENEARVVVCDDTVDVLWPDVAGRCHWTVQVPNEDAPPSKRQPVGSRTDFRVPVELVQHYIRQRSPWFRGRPVENDDHAIHVNFQPALARSFGRECVWLAGEAAHVTLPIGGQSLNAGVREAHELASSIAQALRTEASPMLFSRYEREAHREWRQLLGLVGEPATHGMTNPWVAANAKRLVPCIPATGKHLAELTAQIGIALPTPRIGQSA